MRKLLILSSSDLDNRVVQILRRNDWDLMYASDIDQARVLAEQDESLVGLAMFPPDDEAQIKEYEAAIQALPTVKWVAALPKRDIQREDIKSLIVERLYDFHVYPLGPARLCVALGHAYGIARLEREIHGDQRSMASGRFGLIGTSPAMLNLYRTMERAAASDLPVLILGATGTGKEQVARSIHANSSRASGPFVAVNCAAIPTTLIQSELFGYEEGAFTHAFKAKVGRIEAAAGGTLFLDEIGELPLESQASLLRFLEDGEVTPLGGNRSTKVDVRVLASTNKDLQKGIEEKSFREDLFYRLAVLIIRTPPLRDRSSDVGMLAQSFLGEAVKATGTGKSGFTKEALTAMSAYGWPGNLRELRSRIVQGVLQSEGRYLSVADLGLEGPEGQEPVRSLQEARDAAEKKTLQFMLKRNRWNVSRTANDLRISRMTLYRLLEKHHIERTA
jgi:DNA-binding NtrC family response regulator